jgi:hypothetical protein
VTAAGRLRARLTAWTRRRPSHGRHVKSRSPRKTFAALPGPPLRTAQAEPVVVRDAADVEEAA